MGNFLLISTLTIAAILSLNCVELVPHPPTTTAAPAASAAKNGAVYDTKFDNVDLDEILQQERLLNNYINCLESTGPCTPDGKMLKDTLPEAITTDCSKCSVKQKYGAERVTHYLIDNRPEDWQRLEKIYDPDGEYRAKYLAEKTKASS